MDPTLQTALVTMLTDIKDGAIDGLVAILPVAGLVVASVAVLFFLIKGFRAIAHV